VKKDLLKARIEEAQKLLGVAETDLTHAMSELEAGVRANKTIVSEAIRDAFVQLREARENVANLVTLLTDDDDGA
jgi:F0F1-type ATP synthase membrane subunit b/b'